MTHFAPIDSARNGGTWQAVCGVYISLRQHRPLPDCPTCRAYALAAPQREAEDEATARALEREFPEFAGKLTTK